MHSFLSHHLLRSRGLQAPEGRQGTSEDVLCSDGVGVPCVAARDAQKFLSPAIQLVHRATDGACAGGVGRIIGQRQNTVLLGFEFDPVDCLPVHPRGKCLTKRFTSIFMFPSFQSGEVLVADGAKLGPRQEIDGVVDVVGALGECPVPSLGLGFAPPDFIPDRFEFPSVVMAVRVGDQFVDAEIHAQDLAPGLGWQVGDVDPQNHRALRQGASLGEFRSGFGQPLIKDGSLSGGDSYSMAFMERRKTNNKIERTTSFLDSNLHFIDYGISVKKWTRDVFSFGCPLGTDDNSQCLFQSHTFVPCGEPAIFKDLVGWDSGFVPEVFDVEVDGRTVGLEESVDRHTFPGGGEFEAYFAGPLHRG